MADRTQENTHSVVGDVKSALKGVKGVGDALRGTVNESVDTAFQDGQGEALNRSIKEKGYANVDATEDHFKRKPATAPQTGLSTGGVAGTETRSAGDRTTTGAGAHSGAVGNMNSQVPQQNLGGEPAPATERY